MDQGPRHAPRTARRLVGWHNLIPMAGTRLSGTRQCSWQKGCGEGTESSSPARVDPASAAWRPFHRDSRSRSGAVSTRSTMTGPSMSGVTSSFQPHSDRGREPHRANDHTSGQIGQSSTSSPLTDQALAHARRPLPQWRSGGRRSVRCFSRDGSDKDSHLLVQPASRIRPSSWNNLRCDGRALVATMMAAPHGARLRPEVRCDRSSTTISNI